MVERAIGSEHFLAEYRCARAALGNINQHALAKLDPLHVGAVGAQRLLAIGARLEIVEEGARDPAAGHLPEVVDTGH